MKLKDFLKICSDTDIHILVGSDTIIGTEYRYVEPYLENEVVDIFTAGYEHISIKLKEKDNGTN